MFERQLLSQCGPTHICFLVFFFFFFFFAITDLTSVNPMIEDTQQMKMKKSVPLLWVSKGCAPPL